jgi:homoserine kinase
MTTGRGSATAFAPASVGNVAVGFDVLGLSMSALGDRVRAVRRSEAGVAIRSIEGVVRDLPLAAERNTAGMAVLALQRSLRPSFGVELEIVKGIPLGSGLGGSAASAVAGVVAAAALLDRPVPMIDLLRCAMQGEVVASGALHVDNIAPSLYGGLVLTVGIDDPHVKQIPVPDGVRCVVVHPHMVLATREARAILSSTVSLSDVIWQQANLAGFLAGCYTSDLTLIRESLLDVIIEPQRQALIPGFADVKAAALGAGALGCSISGAGPSVFAWALEAQAEAVRAGMVAAFTRHGLASDSWQAAIDQAGARVTGD